MFHLISVSYSSECGVIVIDVNGGSYYVHSVVCDDVQQNNKKTVLHLKTGDYANFVKLRQKSIFSPQGWFLVKGWLVA